MQAEGGYFEPLAADRVWFNHRDTGDRGYRVTREGKEAIRYDRPGIDQYSFDTQKWLEATDKLPQFSAIQIAQVCFEADKKLCWAMGRPDLAKREWLDMTEKARKKWLEDGPSDASRKAVYVAIREAMK